MKRSDRYFIHRLAACAVALSFCLTACSANMESLPPDPDLPDFSATESLPDPSEPAAVIEEFEQDPYTTEFIIDRTLAQAVRERQELPDDIPLTKELAATVTEISGVGIRTLTRISNFASLRWLFVSETACRDIRELTQIPFLISVYISYGYITEIPDFSDCPNLTELCLPSNCITDVTPLCGAASLRTVDLNSNDIYSIAPLKDVTFLESLCLDGNGITDYAVIGDNQPLRQAPDAGNEAGKIVRLYHRSYCVR